MDDQPAFPRVGGSSSYIEDHDAVAGNGSRRDYCVEAYNNGEMAPRSEKGQVRAIDPTRCANKKGLARTGDEQGGQGH